MREGGGQRAEDKRGGRRASVPDCGRRGLLLDAEACFRTQRPASLQNDERSVGPQALGPKLDVGSFGRRDLLSDAEACVYRILNAL
jgi:hypothetical protein